MWRTPSPWQMGPDTKDIVHRGRLAGQADDPSVLPSQTLCESPLQMRQVRQEAQCGVAGPHDTVSRRPSGRLW